jgi:L-malate glycosyltransferase
LIPDVNNIKTRPLRVLHIIDSLGGGGSERLLWDIVRLSDPRRVKHRVVTIFPEGYPGAPVYAEPLRQLGAYRGATRADTPQRHVAPSTSSVTGVMKKSPRFVKRTLAPIWNFAFLIWQHLKRIAAHLPSMMSIPAEYFRNSPDVIHTHGFYGFKYGLLFKSLFRCPLVHTVPSLFSQMDAQGTGWLANRYRRFHGRVDCFALDPGYRSELTSVGVPAEKLLDIHGTLDLKAIVAVKAERAQHRRSVRDRLGLTSDAILTLSVGRLDPSKGHSYALEALSLMLRQFPNLHWILLGEGEQRTELENRISELGLEQHAHLAGFDPDPLPFYAAADIYLRTTTIEGENISSRQAIAMGLPTVGFDNGCETDLIAKLGHGILVPNADPTSLADGICRILSLPDRGATMGALGTDYCNAHLGIQTHVDDLLTLYTHLREGDASNQRLMSAPITHR